jgi:hypothetical protein
MTRKSRKTEERKPRVRTEPFMQPLRVALTKEEVADRHERLTHLMGEKSKRQAAIATERAEQRAELKKMSGEIDSLAAEAREKSVEREVQCERRFLYDEGKLQEVRLDTGAVIFERPLLAAEQPELPFPEGGADLEAEFGAGAES